MLSLRILAGNHPLCCCQKKVLFLCRKTVQDQALMNIYLPLPYARKGGNALIRTPTAYVNIVAILTDIGRTTRLNHRSGWA
jgi:hypothetical protein